MINKEGNDGYDIVPEVYYCPRCGLILKEKLPKDKYIVVNLDKKLRLFCTCGYYRDEIINDLGDKII